jgi:hypothetical protein
MIGWTHFVHKFKNAIVDLPISFENRVKDVPFEKDGIVFVHCVTTRDKPYMFTISLEYNISPFHLLVFLKSLEKSKYESLMK